MAWSLPGFNLPLRSSHDTSWHHLSTSPILTQVGSTLPSLTMPPPQSRRDLGLPNHIPPWSSPAPGLPRVGLASSDFSPSKRVKKASLSSLMSDGTSLGKSLPFSGPWGRRGWGSHWRSCPYTAADHSRSLIWVCVGGWFGEFPVGLGSRHPCSFWRPLTHICHPSSSLHRTFAPSVPLANSGTPGFSAGCLTCLRPLPPPSS